MSIDSRLRDGLRAEPVEAIPDWSDVLARAARADSRSRTHRRAGLVLAAAAAVALVLVLLLRPDTGDLEPAPPPPSPTTSVPEPHPIEGSWTTGTRPASKVVNQLESRGWGRFAIQAFDGEVPQSYAVEMRLVGGQLTASVWKDDEPQGVWDVESYSVVGPTVFFRPEGISCRSGFRWRVAGDRLTLRPTSDDCPDFRGAPNEVAMFLPYAAAPFRRVTE